VQAQPAGEGDVKATCVNTHANVQELRREVKLLAARDVARECSKEACPGPIRTECAQWLFEIESGIPSVVIEASVAESAKERDKGVMHVFIDGKQVAVTEGTPIEVDPGLHEFRFERPPFPAQTRRTTIRQFEKNHVLLVEFGEPDRPAPSRPVPLPDPSGPAAGDVPSHRPTPAPVYVFMSVAIGSAIASAVLQAVGRVEFSDLESTCKPFCSESDANRVDNLLLASYVTAGVAVAAGATALVWYLARPSEPIEPLAPGDATKRKRDQGRVKLDYLGIVPLIPPIPPIPHGALDGTPAHTPPGAAIRAGVTF
jgi:hypothetical protein